MLSDEQINYLAWLEDRDWSELEPGECVIYSGRLHDASYGWVVHEKLPDDRYTLRSTLWTNVRLNADRRELTPVQSGEVDYL